MTTPHFLEGAIARALKLDGKTDVPLSHDARAALIKKDPFHIFSVTTAITIADLDKPLEEKKKLAIDVMGNFKSADTGLQCVEIIDGLAERVFGTDSNSPRKTELVEAFLVQAHRICALAYGPLVIDPAQIIPLNGPGATVRREQLLKLDFEPPVP